MRGIVYSSIKLIASIMLTLWSLFKESAWLQSPVFMTTPILLCQVLQVYFVPFFIFDESLSISRRDRTLGDLKITYISSSSSRHWLGFESIIMIFARSNTCPILDAWLLFPSMFTILMLYRTSCSLISFTRVSNVFANGWVIRSDNSRRLLWVKGDLLPLLLGVHRGAVQLFVILRLLSSLFFH